MESNLSNAIDRQSSEYRLEATLLMLNRHNVVFSKTMAAKLVGGYGNLGRLIEEGRIRVEKKASGKQNGKWYCNGGDVIRNIKI